MKWIVIGAFLVMAGIQMFLEHRRWRRKLAEMARRASL